MNTARIIPVYLKLLKTLPLHTVLCFQVKDSYYIWGETAPECAKILGGALTRDGETPTCNFPVYGMHYNIILLTKAGKNVMLVPPENYL